MLNNFKQYLKEKAGVTNEQFDLLAKKLSAKKISKGTVLVRPGMAGSDIFFVSKGLLRTYTIDSFGKEHIIQFAPENWWTGDRNSFYFNEPALYFVDVYENSEVVYINRALYESLPEIIPGFNLFNIKILHNSIRFMERRINLLLSATAEERYLNFISLYPDLTARVPQWMIASYLGITPETLSRVRKELSIKH